MYSLRPMRSQAKRPSIQAIANFLLAPAPQTHGQRCISHSTNLTSSRIYQSSNRPNCRTFSSSVRVESTPKPKTHDRGPASTEDTQTDFSTLDVLGSTPAPSTSIDACLHDGFHLNNGVKITDGDGVLLLAGEAFRWLPWVAGGKENGRKLVNGKGQWEVDNGAWSVLELVWPKPGTLLHLNPQF